MRKNNRGRKWLIIMQPSGKSVDCAYGDTVLMALEKAGYALPNNCRAGACGECKVKVTQGQFDQGMVLDMALSQTNASQGYGLMCMAKPISDELTIEWGTEDAKPSSSRRAKTPSSWSPTRSHRRPRRRAAPAPGRPADPLLARPVRHHRQPARRHSGPRLFHFQRPAPGRRTGAAGRPAPTAA
jgi:ferredoxin